jgi:uncharacterized protein YdaU (DUF1376 family)
LADSNKGGTMRPNQIAAWQNGARGYSAMRSPVPLFARFAGKLVLDILPAALASVIGGFLFTQYQFGRPIPTVQPEAAQASPASADVLALVREEHDAVVGYLRSELAAEKSRLAAEDAETARAVAEAKTAQEQAAQEQAAQEQAAQEQENEAQVEAAPELTATEAKLASAAPMRHGPATNSQARAVLPRAKPALAAAPPAGTPLLIAQAGQSAQQNDAASPPERLARDPDSLLAKTLDLKDQVVAATRHAVATIGDVFASVGERISGTTAPAARPFSSDS